MSYLVTGGAGALGSAISRNLVNRGETPIILDINEDYRLLTDIKAKIIFVKGDVTFADYLNTILEQYNVHCIIHTAALLSASDPRIMIPMNTRAMENLLWAALDCRIKRVVNISSKAVYNTASGEYGHPYYKPVKENYKRNKPMGFYGVTKNYGEMLGNEFSNRYGLEFVSLRFSTMYGPGRLLKNPYSPMVLPCRIIENAMLHKPFKWEFGGDQFDDFIGYDDASEGVVLAALAPKENLRQNVYNIGTGKGYTLRDFAAAAKAIFPDFQYYIGPGLNHTGSKTPAYCIYDIGAAMKDLGYQPKNDLVAGIYNYIETMSRLGIAPTFVE
ncbi:MAG TPA: hypothetical protein DD811_14180 [Syntrophomonas sp.]|jgi:UDP-glucose 4-epimerase|nr:hypothetical protein [Syntrophomonas sp.]